MNHSRSGKFLKEMTSPLSSTDHGGGWGLVASPVFKTGVTRPSRVWWVRFPHSPAIALLLSVLFASAAFAQRVDSTQVAAKPGKLARITECLPIPVDTTTKAQVPSVIIGPVAPKSGSFLVLGRRLDLPGRRNGTAAFSAPLHFFFCTIRSVPAWVRRIPEIQMTSRHGANSQRGNFGKRIRPDKNRGIQVAVA